MFLFVLWSECIFYTLARMHIWMRVSEYKRTCNYHECVIECVGIRQYGQTSKTLDMIDFFRAILAMRMCAVQLACRSINSQSIYFVCTFKNICLARFAHSNLLYFVFSTYWASVAWTGNKCVLFRYRISAHCDKPQYDNDKVSSWTFISSRLKS